MNLQNRKEKKTVKKNSEPVGIRLNGNEETEKPSQNTVQAMVRSCYI